MRALACLWLLAALPALAGNAQWLALGEVVTASVGGGGDGGAGPSFTPRQRTAVLAAVGQPAQLDCTVTRLGDKSVSWVRSRDLQIMVHGGAVFTSDARVSAPRARDTHSLRVSRLRLSDAGRYECQLNTDPKLSLFFNLTVVDEPMPEVVVSALGGRAVSARAGGAATLACEARYSPAPRALPLPPLALQWTRDGDPSPRPLSLQRSRGGGVSLDTERWGAARVVSRLTLAELRAADAGAYSCGAADPQGRRVGDTLTLTLDREEDIEHIEAMQRDQSAQSGAAPPATLAALLPPMLLLALPLPMVR